MTHSHVFIEYTGWAKHGTVYVEPLNFVKY